MAPVELVNGKVPLPNFRDFVPDALRVPPYLLILFMIQVSNGMYFSAFSQMKGEMSLTQADTAMMGQTLLVGMTFFFPVAFRLKSIFTNRQCLLISTAVLICLTLLFPTLDSMPLRLAVCFAAGFFRLWATFECLSNLTMRFIMPSGNFGIFLSFVFFVVVACLNVFNCIQVHIIDAFGWKYMHLVGVCALMIAQLTVLVFMKNHKNHLFPMGPFEPVGYAVWSIFLLSLVFVFCYGEQLEWLDSPYIRVAAGVSMLTLAYGIWNMFHSESAVISGGAFSLKYFPYILIAFLVLDVLLATQTTLQNTYFYGVLGMDAKSASKLNLCDFVGGLMGTLFTLYVLTRLKWSFVRMSFIGFAAVLAYLVGMYWVMTPYTSNGWLALPLIFCGFGHVVLYIVLTVYVQRYADFKVFFQMLCLLGFIRTGVGGPIGDSFFERGMTALVPVNGLMGAMRELYGVAILMGVVTLVVILAVRIREINAKPACSEAR